MKVGDGRATFQTSGKTIEFAGFLRAYVEGSDNPEAELADKEMIVRLRVEADAGVLEDAVADAIGGLRRNRPGFID